MPQPVYRWAESGDESHDGALFFFSRGTNPEVLLALVPETHQWGYVLRRVTASSVQVTLSGTVVWEQPALPGLRTGAGDVYRIVSLRE